MSTSIISYNKNKVKIKEVRKRFVIFSGLALLVVLCISIIAFTFHQDVINQLKSIGKINKVLLKQSALIKEITVYGKFFDEGILDSEMDGIRKSLNLKVKDLKKTTANLSSLLLRNESASMEDLNTYLENKKIRSKMYNYVKHVNTMLDDASSNKEIKESILYISRNSANGDTEYINELLSIVESESLESMDRLEKMGLAIILLCLLEVFIVWFFLFRPLNATILEQNKELLESALKVESASRSRTDFLANVSHEIRTPMTAILGYADLLRNKDHISKPEAEEFISIINKNASHLLGLLDEVLDVSKMESGKFDLALEKIELSKILDEVYSLLKVKAEEKEIELLFESKGGIPQFLMADPKRLKQILFNVVGNAIKFTEQGSVKLVASLKTSSSLEFKVIDTGCGIPKEKIKIIFNPFEQAYVAADRQYSGTGLGLVLSRGLARKMGGDVRISKTKIGEGTTFIVTIDPGEISTHTIDEEISLTSLEKDNFSAEKNDLKGQNILVVDDAKENARLFKMYLESAGAQVELVFDGFSALEIIKNQSFDLILLDLQMPGMDGYQVMKELSKVGYTGAVCALTAHAMSEELEKTKNHGFHGHITKPISSKDLISSVNMIIS